LDGFDLYLLHEHSMCNSMCNGGGAENVYYSCILYLLMTNIVKYTKTHYCTQK